MHHDTVHILVTETPEVEIVDGLFVVSYRIGGELRSHAYPPHRFIKAHMATHRLVQDFLAQDGQALRLERPG